MISVACGETAAYCVCVKETGHVEAGDKVHACDHDICTGEWSGDFASGDSFRIVEFPMAVAR